MGDIPAFFDSSSVWSIATPELDASLSEKLVVSFVGRLEPAAENIGIFSSIDTSNPALVRFMAVVVVLSS